MSIDGTIYLLHFNKPFGHAKHYLGWTKWSRESIAGILDGLGVAKARRSR